MKKVETHLYELTPKEVAELPQGYQVLQLDVFAKRYRLIKGGKLPLELLGTVFFIFDLPKNCKLKTE